MPRIYFYPEIVQERASLKDTPDKIVSPQAALILDNPHAPGLFQGLYRGYPIRSEALITGILAEGAWIGESVFPCFDNRYIS